MPLNASIHPITPLRGSGELFTPLRGVGRLFTPLRGSGKLFTPLGGSGKAVHALGEWEDCSRPWGGVGRLFTPFGEFEGSASIRLHSHLHLLPCSPSPMARYLTRALLPRWRDAFSDFPLYLPRFEIRIERDAFSDFRSLLLISQFAVNSLTLKLILLDSQSPTPEPSRHHPLAIPPPADLNRRLISIWLCHFIRITTGPFSLYTFAATGTPILLNLHIFTHLKIEGVEKETTRRIKEKETTRVREKTHRPVHTPGSLSPHLSDPSHSPVSEPPTVLRPSDANSDQEAIEINVTKLLLRSYYDIVRKNIEDYVPKAIMHFLVNHTKLELHNVFIKKLYRAAAGLLFLSMPRAVSVSQVLADFLLSREVVSRAALGCSVLMGSATATL
ncbi:hypothetical protein LXL04_015863 [Taraxacum kok-saghyz]